MGFFTKKSLEELRDEAERGGLRRALGPLNLTALGIGSIIGTGIFVLTGTAASQNAGPGLIYSMLISATGCAFSGLCYAEFAAMVPVAGSAYTYAFATVGELVAWIIGWDLILEYALSVSTVAVGWSGYFVSLAHDVGLEVPVSLAGPPGPFNLPAAVIVLTVAALLVIGIKESADINTVLVGIKIVVLLVFIAAGAYVNRANLTPIVPANTGEFDTSAGAACQRRGRDVLRLYRVRRRLDGGAGSQESDARHADRDPGVARDLHAALHRGRHCPARCRALPAARRRRSARRRHRRDRPEMAGAVREDRRALRVVQHDARATAGADANLLLDEP
jgi:hypothetical protein